MTTQSHAFTLTEQETHIRLRAAAFVGVGVPALIYFGIMAAIESEWVLCALAFITSATIVVCFLFLWQRRRGYAAVRPAIACYTALLLYLVAFSGPEHVRTLWLLTLPLVSTLLLPPREGGIWAAGSMLMAAYLMLQGGRFDGSSSYSAAYILRFTIVYGLLSAVLIWSEILLQRYQARLQGQNAMLAEERDRLEKEVIERAALEEELRYLATTDPLTGLLNRRGFERRLDEALADFTKTGAPSALILFDLDHFKSVNDNGGHALGDELLRRVAQVVAWEVRRSDHLARQGGDEFGLLLPSCTLSQARTIAETVRKVVSQVSVSHEGHEYFVTASIGLTVFQEGDDAIETVLARADAASYASKRQGRNGVVVHAEEA